MGEVPDTYGAKAELPTEGREMHYTAPVEMAAVGQSPQEVEAPMKPADLVKKLNQSPLEMEGNFQPLEALDRAYDPTLDQPNK